jgi:hypothetical protein
LSSPPSDSTTFGLDYKFRGIIRFADKTFSKNIGSRKLENWDERGGEEGGCPLIANETICFAEKILAEFCIIIIEVYERRL